MCQLGGTQGRVKPHFQQDRCGCMDQYGMHQLGPPIMGDTKLIITTNPLLVGIQTSKSVAV